ncbi:MAG: hypothetical protein ACM3Q1_12495 [Bacteroidales bacterium]
MSWTLSRKVSAALVGILLSTMVLTGLFGYSKFGDVLSGLVSSRYSFVVFTIKQKIEDRLALGLPLRQLRQVQDLMELEKARDSQILGIQIYDLNREVLFDTERGAIGSRVPADWLEPLAAQVSQPFNLRDDDNALVGLPLISTLGKVEGAVVLRYPAAYLEHELGRLLSRLAAEFAAVLIGFALIAVAAAAVLLGGVRRRLRAMEDTLDKTLTLGGEAVPAEDGEEFSARFAEFCGKAREAVEQMGDASQEVERLDRLV